MKTVYTLRCEEFGCYDTVFESRLEAYAKADELNAESYPTSIYYWWVLEKKFKHDQN